MFNDHYNSKIIIDEGRTVLEWTRIQQDPWAIDKIYIERKVGASDWEVIGTYYPDSNVLTHRFVDEAKFPIERNQKIFIISYRLKIVSKSGIIESSSEISYDLWWKKYLQFIENYEDVSHILADEIFKFVEKSIKSVLYKRYISTFYKRNIDEYFIIDEACQEIFLKLLESRKRPSLNYYSFWKYVNKVVNNWMITYLMRNKGNHFIRLTEELHQLEKSPEDNIIKVEETKVFLKVFSNLFSVYIDELWGTYPVSALITEFWIKRKKDFIDNFSDLFNRTINFQQGPQYIKLDDLEDHDDGQTTLYSGILMDLISVGQNPELMNRFLKKIPSKKRASFESAIKEYSSLEHQKSINRIKQRIKRSLAIIRLKMQDDLKDF